MSDADERAGGRLSERDAEDRAAVEREALDVADDRILAQMIEDEKVETEDLDISLLFKLFRYLGAHRTMALTAVGLAIVEAFLMTMPAYAIGLAIDHLGDRPGRDENLLDAALTAMSDNFVAAGAEFFTPEAGALVFFATCLVCIWLLRWAVAVGTSYLMQKLGQLVVHDLRVDVFGHVTGMDLGYFHDNPVGRLVNRTTFDVQALSQLFSDAFAQGVRDLLFIVVLVGVMLGLDLTLGLMLIGAFPFLVAIGWLYRNLARPALRTQTAVQSRMNAWLAENLAGMRENHLYRRRARRAAEYEDLTRAHQASVTRVIQAWSLIRPGMMMISAIATALVLLIGYDRVTGGLISVGVLLTFIQYTNEMWRPVRNLAEKFNLIQTSLASGERVMDVLETDSAMSTPEDASPDLEVTSGEIRFEDVHFRYEPEGEEILCGIDFAVEPGEMLALVGDTGAGKSTIAHLISRFYDVDSGTVCIDGADVRDYTLEHLRRGIAIVPQDVVIFAGTIRDNITMGLDVEEARLRSCIEAVRADEIVERFEEGLDHVLEEGGRTLSTGERQLLSFARALVYNPPILILDEATANVDTRTEQLIQRGLERLTSGRTSVVIAHRLSTIREADQILMLRDGAIVERGSHDELVEQGGAYERLYQLHMGLLEEPGQPSTR